MARFERDLRKYRELDEAEKVRPAPIPATTYLADPDEPCRICGGDGMTRETIEHGKTLYQCCWQCGGLGHRSVRIN